MIINPIKHITDPGFNFKNYRLIWRHQKSSAPCGIPFVSLLVKDACFQAEESRKICQSQAEIPNTDMTKKMVQSFLKVAEPLQFLLSRSQDIPLIELNEDLVKLIKNPLLNDDLLYLGSFKTESPNNAYEKNAYKQLKLKFK